MLTPLIPLLLSLAPPDAAPPANVTSSPPKSPAAPAARSDFTTEGMDGLEAAQRDQILTLLAAAGFPHGPLLGSLWHRREKTYLVAAVDASRSDEPPRLHVVAFDLSGPSVRRLASSEGPFELGRDDKLRGFDFAAYRLTTKEYAFGLRYKRWRGYAGGGASLEGVILFRLHGQVIDEILHTPTSYEADIAGDWHEDQTRDHDESSGNAFIIVRKHKTGGYFDWVKKVEGGRAVTLVWNGECYVMNGRDPLVNRDLEIFDD